MLVALFARAWIEIKAVSLCLSDYVSSPSLRGRGLKSRFRRFLRLFRQVALFARAWIEILYLTPFRCSP